LGKECEQGEKDLVAKLSKENQLIKLRKECTVFFDDLYKTEKKILVFGEGNADAKLVLVGEAPGKQETIQRRPFVGSAGKNLDEFIEIVGLKRDDLYITNVVKFRPFKVDKDTGRISNRPPTREEIELCRSWLYKEIEIIQPMVVVSLGNVALQALTDDWNKTIGQLHGTPIAIKVGENGFAVTLFPLYHPASVIYRKGLRDTYLNDLQALKKYLQDLHV